MDITFDKIRNLIPRKCCQKFRKDSEFVIVTNYANKMFFLNPTSSEIFLLCNGENSIGEIREKMLSIYDVSVERLESDLTRAIRDFQWNDIIELAYSH